METHLIKDKNISVAAIIKLLEDSTDEALKPEELCALLKSWAAESKARKQKAKAIRAEVKDQPKPKPEETIAFEETPKYKSTEDVDSKLIAWKTIKDKAELLLDDLAMRRTLIHRNLSQTSDAKTMTDYAIELQLNGARTDTVHVFLSLIKTKEDK